MEKVLSVVSNGSEVEFRDNYNSTASFFITSLDGYEWKGNLFETILENSGYRDLIRCQHCLNKHPVLFFDYGNFCQHPEFEYIFVPNNSNTAQFVNYNVYALTNNKTILQYVGYIQIDRYYTQTQSHQDNYGGTAVLECEPDENYTPSS